MYNLTSKVLLRTVAAVIFGTTTACAFSAQAGECPADKRMPNARQAVDFKAVGVTDTTLGAIDLGKEQASIAGRELRFRKLVIEPGGIVPWHSHDDRPALIYVAEGEIHEYASNCAAPIVHKTGEIRAETHGTAHWWKNLGDKTVVLFVGAGNFMAFWRGDRLSIENKAAYPEPKEIPAMPTEILVKDLRRAFEQARELDGSMAERLDVFADATRKLHPTTAAIVDRLVVRLREHNAGEDSPKLGEVMPPFVLPDETGRLVSLSDLLAQGPAVITFHRGHWCPYCRISISTLVKAQPRIEALGARMVAIVPDREQFAAEMREDCHINFPILSDMDNGYAMSLNLAIWVGAEMQEYMSKIGRVLPQYQGNESWMLPIPATFVVGKDGRIKSRFVDPDYRKRMAIDDLIDALK